MRSTMTRVITGVVLLMLGGLAPGASSIDWSTIDGGGGMMSGGAFALTGTIGQPDAGAMSGGTFSLTGGFWSVTPPCGSFVAADFNLDCYVNELDFAIFKACATGQSVPYNPAALPAGCGLSPDGQGRIAADFDHDGDVDMDDFARFQRCYSGSLQLPQAGCSN
jgi:hypothetical protein